MKSRRFAVGLFFCFAVSFSPARGVEEDDLVHHPGCEWGMLLPDVGLKSMEPIPGGYVLAGTKYQDIRDPELSGILNWGAAMCIDEDGTITATLEMDGEEYPSAINDIVPFYRSDGTLDGFALTGYKIVDSSYDRYLWVQPGLWVARTDSHLVPVWEDLYGNFGDSYEGNALALVGDKLIAVGLDSVMLRVQHGIMSCFDAAGQRSFLEKNFITEMFDIETCGENEFIVSDFIGIAKVKAPWEPEWHGGLGDEFPDHNRYDVYHALAVLPDGSVIAGGSFNENTAFPMCVVAKYGPDGSRVWRQTFGAVGVEDSSGRRRISGGFAGRVEDVVPLPGGGCAAVAQDHLFKIDSAGNLEWDLPLAAWVDCVLSMPDGGILIGGSVFIGEGEAAEQRTWLAKVRSDLHAPEAAFSIDPPPPVFHGSELNFDSSASAAPESAIVSRHWDFGDGTTLDDVVSPAHTYWTNGAYQVTLTIVNADGLSKSLVREVRVEGLQLQWLRELGASSSDTAYGMVEANGKDGFVLVGKKSNRIWVKKLDACGHPVWSRTIGRENNDGIQEGRGIVQGHGGGYVVAGSDHMYFLDMERWRWDVWLLKLDEDGNPVWPEIRVLGDPATNEEARCVAATSDGGYILAASKTLTLEASSGFPWLAKVDGDGVEQWSHLYDFGHSGDGKWVVEAPGGGFVFIADANGVPYKVAKVGGSGEIVWNAAFGHNERGNWIGLRNPPEDGFAVVGMINKDISLRLLTPEGVESSTHSWSGGTKRNLIDAGNQAVRTPDGGFLVVGTASRMRTDRDASNNDVALVKTDAEGHTQWQEFYRGENQQTAERGVAAVALDDGGYVVLATSNDEKSPVFLFKLAMNFAPEPRFTLDPDVVGIDEFFHLDASASSDPDGTVEDWVWHFDDGRVEHGMAGDYRFAEAGVHEIRLTAVDDQGAERDLVKTVTVQGIRLRDPRPNDNLLGGWVETKPGQHRDVFPLGGRVPLFPMETALGFHFEISTSSSTSRYFRATFPQPLSESFSVFRLPDWTEVPFTVIDEFTVEIREHIPIGETSVSYMIAQVLPKPAIQVETLPGGDRFAFSFDSTEHYEYRVESTPDLAEPDWQPVAHSATAEGLRDRAAFSGTGNRETIYVERDAGQPAAFYRLRITFAPPEGE